MIVNVMSESSRKARGTRILNEIASEECSLEEILSTLRLKCSSNYNVPGIPSGLFKLLQSHSLKGSLAIKSNPTTAAATALINHILVYQLTKYCGAVALLDFTGNFTISNLKDQCGVESLNHLYVFRLLGQTNEVFEEVKQWMLFQEHASHNKVWVGTIIIGAEKIGDWNGMEKVLVSCGRNGWMNVARDEPKAFAVGISVDEAWKISIDEGRNVRWKAWCEEGEYKWS
ncbi:hypothetical protein OnM2_030004 [Erysiphe neolycopersici]|uniref:Uncharacterized protein n=1 Tax=Erysiphe neolycopersici TaxID=212602 RepID=A0A420HZI0_9PEZI|nr:hypothetical protein OnM2_030004 [Erysiphe neolycopersici]